MASSQVIVCDGRIDSCTDGGLINSSLFHRGGQKALSNMMCSRMCTENLFQKCEVKKALHLIKNYSFCHLPFMSVEFE